MARAKSEQRFFRQKVIFACNAGRRRLTLMSEQELETADKIWVLLGKRWTLPILHRLAEEKVLRFTELKRSLDGISGTMLAERLLDLEEECLITKEVYVSMPPKVEYRLTASGVELGLIIKQILSWRAERLTKDDTSELPRIPARYFNLNR